jgi:hypothetical protein
MYSTYFAGPQLELDLEVPNLSTGDFIPGITGTRDLDFSREKSFLTIQESLHLRCILGVRPATASGSLCMYDGG